MVSWKPSPKRVGRWSTRSSPSTWGSIARAMVSGASTRTPSTVPSPARAAQRLVLGTRRPRHQLGAARLQRGSEADEEVDARRAGQAFAQITPVRPAGDPAHDLADQEALHVDVVAVGRAGRPPRRLRGE